MMTAVEWLLENLISEPYSEADFQHNFECWDKAKKMEKQQIIDFAHEIADELAYDVYSKKVIEDIFKNTFKSEKYDKNTNDSDLL